MDNETLVSLTADIVAAHVANNTVSVDRVGTLVAGIHRALASLGTQAEPVVQKVPVVSARASIKHDYLVCMECGAKQKTLKRHLQTAHQLTPAQYRQDFALPASYPMVAEEYAGRRRELAKSLGLGRKKGDKVGPRRGAGRKSNGQPTAPDGGNGSA